MFGLDVLRDVEEQVRMIRDNLRVAQSRQKSYADTWRRELVFEIGDYVYLKVSPMRSVRRFNMKEKLAKVYWTFQDFRETWRSSLSVGIA